MKATQFRKKGIQLTPLLLIEFGFKKETELNYEADLIRDLDYPDQKVVPDKLKIFDFKTGKFSVWNTGYINTIEYVHQLQYIWCALTGNDLEKKTL